MEIKKKYVIKCDKCNKELVFDVKLSKISHRVFIDDMAVSKESKCKCLKCGTSVIELQILFRQLLKLNENRDRIAIEIEKQD